MIITHAGSVPDSLTINQNSQAFSPTIHLTSTGDESITINTTVYASYVQIHETDNQLTTVKIKGVDCSLASDSSSNGLLVGAVATDVGASIPLGTTVASSLTTIDASGTTGSFNVVSGLTQNGVSYTGLAIYGGTGGDYITNYADNGSIVAGATTSGANTLTLYGNNASLNDSASTMPDTINLNGLGESATLGSGADIVGIQGNGDSLTQATGPSTGTTSVAISGNGDSVSLGSGTASISFIDENLLFNTAGTATVTLGSGSYTINDGNTLNCTSNGGMLTINGTVSHCKLGYMGFYGVGTASELGPASSITGAQSLDQAINQFVTPNGNGQLVWFQYGGDTYIENSTNAYSTSIVVKITGIVDLSHAPIANGSIYL